MWGVLRRLFDIRSGEGGLVARSALTLFGLIAAHTMLETARDALFLEKLPVSRLTFVYALLAALSVVAARLNGRFIRDYGRRNALVTTLFLSASGTVFVYLLPPTESVVFGLYLWSGLLGSVLVVQFWMLVGNAYTVAQGKRLFGLLASGGVFGAVVGASFSAAMLAYVDVRELLLVASGIFLLTSAFVTTQAIDKVEADLTRESPDNALSGAFGLVSDYPYLVRLAGLVAFSTAAVLATDYLFKAVAASSLRPEALGPFFARYYAVLNTIALGVQLFVSSSLVRRMGVIGAFLVLPVLLVLGGGASFVLGSAVAVFATKGADGALRHSLHRISTELLWMPLPEHVRARAKGLVDTVVVRGTQAVVAMALLGLAMLGFDRPSHLAVMVLVLSAAWLLLGLGLRRPYLDLFRTALAKNPDRGRLELDLRSVEVVVESLSSRDPLQAIAAIDLLEASRRSRLIPALIFYHESKEVVIRALEVLPIPQRSDWIPLTERLLEHEDDDVRVAALEALARNGRFESMQSRLLDISPWVRAHAAFWLVQRKDEKDPATDRDIQLVLEMPGPSGVAGRIGLLDAIEASGDGRWSELLLDLAESDEPQVQACAVKAMTHVRDPRFIPFLIQRLPHRDGRDTVRSAIVALGTPAFEALEKVLEHPEAEPRVVVHVPATMARFADERAARTLIHTLEHGRTGRIRYKALRALVVLTARTEFRLDTHVLERRVLGELQEHFQLLSLHRCLAVHLARDEGPGRESGELLEGLLADKRDQAMQRVFLLLQASFPQEDLRSVENAARSQDKRRRAQAQEFLDALTLSARNPELRPLLRLAVDDLPVDERLVRAAVLLEDLDLDLGSALQRLLRDPDRAVSGLAAYHVLESGREGLESDVLEATQDRPMTESLRELIENIMPPAEAPSVA